MLKCCGTCRFFVPSEGPTLLRLEQRWVWPGKCGWAEHPVPAAAVRCYTAANMHPGCPTWEEGVVDYLGQVPEPRMEIPGGARAEAV